MFNGKDVSNMPGLCFINKNDKFIDNGLSKRIEHIDTLPRPAWHLLKPENYFNDYFIMFTRINPPVKYENLIRGFKIEVLDQITITENRLCIESIIAVNIANIRPINRNYKFIISYNCRFLFLQHYNFGL